MSSKENQKALVEICHQLAAEGLTPGVGLLRGKAPFKVSVLDAIDAIKVFNQQFEAAKAAPAALSDKARIDQLEKRVAQLEQALAVMESRLEKLL
ncbi:hypothetical protein [Alteromonas lipolytica]|uniref:KfrA N-terminal DNA-binding domain-containing protein n=1 Tax=Alteromonas lipolytica TaxID=1856405 RepID=A0A1E8FDX2_9ALTE|nr:hypothetical protein [Alteromonas lipolytica]OFI34120.1 hypothetical protein BFC17_21485 [Alteromonas lipolytica]GGF65230.1 hypothetical protein GCM10011338_16990 [Alteromonas lipolytica]